MSLNHFLHSMVGFLCRVSFSVQYLFLSEDPDRSGFKFMYFYVQLFVFFRKAFYDVVGMIFFLAKGLVFSKQSFKTDRVFILNSKPAGK